jgi:hypothetical protein
VCTGCWWGSLRERELGRPRGRRGDNIKMDLQEVGGGWGGLWGLDGVGSGYGQVAGGHLWVR